MKSYEACPSSWRNSSTGVVLRSWKTRARTTTQQRFEALSYIGEHLHVMVFTPRDGAVHVISLRRANLLERTRYAAQPNPELLDQESPELTDEWFAKARPASEVLPGLFGEAVAKAMLKPKRGRPALATPKEHINIWLEWTLLERLRSLGTCWQTTPFVSGLKPTRCRKYEYRRACRVFNREA